MSAELKFVDTNVLVYLFDGDSPGKQAQARELLGEEAENIVLSTQVLGEFYVTVTRKLANPLGADMARKAVGDLCAFQVRSLQTELVRAAVSRSGESKLSYWGRPDRGNRDRRWRGRPPDRRSSARTGVQRTPGRQSVPRRNPRTVLMVRVRGDGRVQPGRSGWRQGTHRVDGGRRPRHRRRHGVM